MTSQDAQAIFNIAASKLSHVPQLHAHYALKNLVPQFQPEEKPITQFLSSAKEDWFRANLDPKEFDEQFFVELYEHALRTGATPKNRNFAVVNLTLNAFSKLPVSTPDVIKATKTPKEIETPILKPFKCWIDLDYLDHKISNFCKIENRVFAKHSYSYTQSSCAGYKTQSDIILRLNTWQDNFNKNDMKQRSSFNILLITGGVLLGLTGLALLVASIAATSYLFLALSASLVWGGILLGGLSYNNFFKSPQVHNPKDFDKYPPNDIGVFFNQHILNYQKNDITLNLEPIPEREQRPHLLPETNPLPSI